jgi:hypothetical protein
MQLIPDSLTPFCSLKVICTATKPLQSWWATCWLSDIYIIIITQLQPVVELLSGFGGHHCNIICNSLKLFDILRGTFISKLYIILSLVQDSQCQKRLPQPGSKVTLYWFLSRIAFTVFLFSRKLADCRRQPTGVSCSPKSCGKSLAYVC